MIACFPTPYPDELLYSLFARYFVKSGYMGYASAAEDLFAKKTVHPDIEFINMLSGEVLYHLQKIMTLEDLIMKHTMFPYYGRFLRKERRRQALAMLIEMDERYHNLIYTTKSKPVVRCLRYCSICAAEDRKKYGEAYWHRSHQLVGVNICAVHGCRLFNSMVQISSKTSPYLYSAEEMATKENKEGAITGDLELRITRYVNDVFNFPMDMNTDIPVGRFLHAKMEYTKYLSPRGEQRNMALLFRDFAEHYKSIDNNLIQNQWQLQKIMSSDRLSTYEICLVAMFLGISPTELTHMNLPEKTQPEWFDEKIRTLHSQGLKYPEIARIMGAPYDVVKAIGEGRYSASSI